MFLILFRFIAMVSIAIALAGGLAHAFEFPHKIDMTRADYLVVQQIYGGWALLGIPIVVGLLASLVVALIVRSHPLPFRLTMATCVCLVLQLVNFFLFTQPANRATQNWTVLPENWETLRAQWEYSHLVSAGLFMAAFLSMLLSVLLAPLTHQSHGVYSDRVYRSMFG